MNRLNAISTFIIFLWLIIGVIGPVFSLSFNNDYMLYVYGSKSCPHCHRLANYLIDRNMAFTWFWIEDKDNFNYLKRISEDFGITRGTPTVIVYSGGKPVAIIVGAVLNDNFWKNVIDKPANALRIYIGESLTREIPIPQDFDSKYIAVKAASFDDVRTYAKGAEPTDIIEYLPTIILLIILVSMVVVIMKGRKG